MINLIFPQVSEKDMEIRDMKEKRIEDLRQLSSRLSQAVTREIGIIKNKVLYVISADNF